MTHDATTKNSVIFSLSFSGSRHDQSNILPSPFASALAAHSPNQINTSVASHLVFLSHPLFSSILFATSPFPFNYVAYHCFLMGTLLVGCRRRCFRILLQLFRFLKLPAFPLNYGERPGLGVDAENANLPSSSFRRNSIEYSSISVFSVLTTLTIAFLESRVKAHGFDVSRRLGGDNGKTI